MQCLQHIWQVFADLLMIHAMPLQPLVCNHLHPFARLPQPLICNHFAIRAMASNPIGHIESLGQVLGKDTDGPLTFSEALSVTDGMRIQPLAKHIIVNKEPEEVKIDHLPLRIMNMDGGKRRQFVDVINDYEGVLDKDAIGTLFCQQRYTDFPAPIVIRGDMLIPYTMQLFYCADGRQMQHLEAHPVRG